MFLKTKRIFILLLILPTSNKILSSDNTQQQLVALRAERDVYQQAAQNLSHDFRVYVNALRSVLQQPQPSLAQFHQLMQMMTTSQQNYTPQRIAQSIQERHDSLLNPTKNDDSEEN